MFFHKSPRLGLATAAALCSFTFVPANAANIVETAAAAGQFKTLIAAAKAAGLAGTLSNTDPLTVFAPTDAAFAKLPKGTVASLLKPENKAKLKAILTYHVLPARVAAKDVPEKPTLVGTVNGAKVRIVRNGTRVHVDKASVIKADIKADNGIIHVIDSVLIPKKRSH